MKIVFPVLALEKGGGARYIYQLANALQDRGHEVEVIIPKYAPLAWPLHTKITKVQELTPATIPPADFILPNWWVTVSPAREAKKGQVVRLSQGYEPLWVSQKALARETYLIDAPIISVSEWHRQVIFNDTGRNSVVIPGGVDTDIFRPQSKPSTFTGRLTVLYIARARSHGYFWKGCEDFWEACRRLKTQIPDFNLQIVTPEREYVPAPVLYELRIPENDHDLARLYAEADLFVSTSYFESFSLVQLEAMACGTAVVTTDCGGSREYTRHGENCLVVPPSDIDQLTAAMARLLLDNGERERLASAGHEFVQPWTWQKNAEKVENFLLQLLARKPI